MGHKILSKKTYMFVGLIVGSLLTTACSLDAALIDLQNKNLLVLNGSQLTGFVSSSAQNQKTTAGYKVQSSSGDYSDKIEETTSGGYKVYISVQGNIISNPL